MSVIIMIMVTNYKHFFNVVHTSGAFLLQWILALLNHHPEGAQTDVY